MQESATRSDNSKSVYGYDGAFLLPYSSLPRHGAEWGTSSPSCCAYRVSHHNHEQPSQMLYRARDMRRSARGLDQRHALFDVRAVLRLQLQIPGRVHQGRLCGIHCVATATRVQASIKLGIKLRRRVSILKNRPCKYSQKLTWFHVAGFKKKTAT